MPDTAQPADFTLSDHGAIALLTPETEAASEWCEEHFPEDAQRLGKAYAVEPRYAGPICDNLEENGFVIQS